MALPVAPPSDGNEESNERTTSRDIRDGERRKDRDRQMAERRAFDMAEEQDACQRADPLLLLGSGERANKSRRRRLQAFDIAADNAAGRRNRETCGMDVSAEPCLVAIRKADPVGDLANFCFSPSEEMQAGRVGAAIESRIFRCCCGSVRRPIARIDADGDKVKITAGLE